MGEQDILDTPQISLNDVKLYVEQNTSMEQNSSIDLQASNAKTDVLDEITLHSKMSPKICENKDMSNNALVKYSRKGKILRATIVVLATIGTAYVCMLSSNRYFHSWVQTVIERTDVHVSEIPFPAVTICPMKSINLNRSQKAKEQFLGYNTTREIDIQFQTILQTLDRLFMLDTVRHTPDEEDSLTKELEKIQVLLKHQVFEFNFGAIIGFMSFRCEELLEECTWRRQKIPCCNIFRKIHTYRGVCYSFNSILVEDPYSTWPWRNSDAGINTGLRVVLKKTIHGEILPKIVTMIHEPTEAFSTDIFFLDVARVFIAVNPLRFTADQDIRTLRPELRRCYFMHEVKLLGKTKSDCIRNCRLSYIERNCNCSYFLPQAVSKNANLPICGVPHLKCIYEHRTALLTTGNIIHTAFDDSVLDCECYPNCNYVQYSTSVYSDSVDLQNDNLHIALQVHYQQETLFSYRSILRFTLLDLIVSYGGIAGLFLGFSLVGIIETIHQFFLYCKKSKNIAEPKENKTSI